MKGCYPTTRKHTSARAHIEMYMCIYILQVFDIYFVIAEY